MKTFLTAERQRSQIAANIPAGAPGGSKPVGGVEGINTQVRFDDDTR